MCLIAIGAIGMVASVAHGIGSRHAAERIFAQPAPHMRVGPHGPPPPHGEQGRHQ